MNPINTTTAATTTTAAGTSSTSKSDPLLSKNAFLQLMMAQLKSQNPLDPSNNDPSQMINELAQFTALEQATNTAQSTAQTASAQQTSAALGLLGHTVSYMDSSGATHTGSVPKVEITSSGPTLTVSGVTGVSPSTVSEVS
jgi:flagellar basal-body rod modification protein FlgD